MICSRTQRHVRQQRAEVILKNIGARVIRILNTPGAFIAGAEVAIRVVGGANVNSRSLLLTLPRPFTAVRRDENPTPRQWIEPMVRVIFRVKLTQNTYPLTEVQLNGSFDTAVVRTL